MQISSTHRKFRLSPKHNSNMKLINILLAAIILNGATALAQTDTLYTQSGKELIITPIKHASMRIQFDGNEIEIDPVTQLPPVTDYATYPKADYIFVTHEHFDHCDKTAVQQLTSDGTVVIANANAAKIIGTGEVMKNGESKDLGIIKVEAVPAYNNSPDKLQFHPKGRDNGYILTIDGLRLYIAGDTEDIEEMAAIKDIDVAFLPCNLPYTMTPEQCAKAARTFVPKILYPYHFSDTKIERVAELLEGSGIEVRIRNFK